MDHKFAIALSLVFCGSMIINVQITVLRLNENQSKHSIFFSNGFSVQILFTMMLFVLTIFVLYMFYGIIWLQSNTDIRKNLYNSELGINTDHMFADKY